MGELTFHYGSSDGQSTPDGGGRRFTVAERTQIERRWIMEVFLEEEEHRSSRLVYNEVSYRHCFDLLPYNKPRLFTAVAFCQKCPLTKKLGRKGEVHG